MVWRHYVSGVMALPLLHVLTRCKCGVGLVLGSLEPFDTWEDPNQ